MEKTVIKMTTSILAQCAINEINQNSLFVGTLLLNTAAKNVELFGINEAKFLMQLVFRANKNIKNIKATEMELNLLNRLQLLNIELLKAGTPKDKRKAKLLDFSVMFKMTNK